VRASSPALQSDEKALLPAWRTKAGTNGSPCPMIEKLA
jgi:hypothetical protein